MDISLRRTRRLLLILAFLPSIAPADAPVPLQGVVRDTSGATLPGVTVRVLSEVSARVVEVVSDGQGAYQVHLLPPGTYRVEAALQGFSSARARASIEIGRPVQIDLVLGPAGPTESVMVTARRLEEAAQDVPIALTAVGGGALASANAFNVDRVKELVPTLQFYSSNPRNSSVSIRGMGAPFGLTNDGIEPGVGLYVDGVFQARPAAATLDFLDVERLEVLRGPQGTLFGKNTTAGAIQVLGRRPSFTREGDFEISLGNIGFHQARASFTGPLAESVAGRVALSWTGREGTLFNTVTREHTNALGNLGGKAQVLFAPTGTLAVTVAADFTRQRPDGYAQVVAGIAPTLRPASRQWPAIAADLHYAAPSDDPFDRLLDTDTDWKSDQDLGGASATVDWGIGPGRLTSVTAWRFWSWDPSNDRDFVGLPVTTVSAAPSEQRQWTQEVRWAGDLSPRLGLVAGVFAFHQSIDSDPAFVQEHGAAAARVLLPPSDLAATPGLLDGYGFEQSLRYRNLSAAAFAQLEWRVGARLRLLPGLRVNYDSKDVDFAQTVYGGLQTTDPALLALQRSILAPQAYAADVDDANTSGQLTAAFTLTPRVLVHATGATGFKSVGLNLNGLPTDARNQPILESAVVRPEDVRHLEVGVKTAPWRGATANVTAFQTTTDDYQTQVVSAQLGVLRGYLANAEKVRVRGLELDASTRVGTGLSVRGAAAWTDGRYLTFTEAPPPLEETGGPQVKDISGSVLPGISEWALSLGGEYARPATVLGRRGTAFAAADASYRSSFSSSPSESRYLVVDGYALLNARVGIRAREWEVTAWGRNLARTDYFQFLTAAPGGSGLYVGLPGDPRTVGVTVRFHR
jgi:iron complex outermembrane recepter protein